MANYANLKATIASNTTPIISAAMAKAAMDAIVDNGLVGYQFIDKATPATNPGTPDAQVFYTATEPGTYTNFDGIVVNDGEACILKGSGSSWTKVVTGAATVAKLTELGQKVSDNTEYQEAISNDITNDYLALNTGIGTWNGKFSTDTYVACAVYKLLAGRTYLFEYNTDRYKGDHRVCILGEIDSPDDVVVNNTFTSLLNGDALVLGWELELTPTEDTYIFTRWHTDAGGHNWNVISITIAESYTDVKTIKDVVGNLEDLDTTDKTSIVDAINEVAAAVANPLAGKILAVDGDSICYGAGYAGGYAGIIAARNGMTLQNLAVGGATIQAETYSGDNPRHWICRNISNLRADADYIILEGGVNDPSGGTMTNYFNDAFDDTKFVGACEVMCRDLYARFAGKKIGFIIVHQVYGFSNFRDTDTKYKALVAVLQKWGIPFCDLNTQVPAFGLLPNDNALRVTYTDNADGWHPNEAGYKTFYCDRIEEWMKTL